MKYSLLAIPNAALDVTCDENMFRAGFRGNDYVAQYSKFLEEGCRLHSLVPMGPMMVFVFEKETCETQILSKNEGLEAYINTERRVDPTIDRVHTATDITSPTLNLVKRGRPKKE
uniref:Uncharacterized protein n=1 Tax=viral metagenome TaxID=1070528 RepID=A0A6H1ZI37_9ZZZZ